jgi:hypothetical protein
MVERRQSHPLRASAAKAMSGVRGATGQPIWMKCAKCRLQQDSNGYALRGNPRATGRRREKHKHGVVGRMDAKYQYEYECGECGHLGWSRHSTIKQQWEQGRMKKKAKQTRIEARLAQAGGHLTWTEINSILGQLALHVAGTVMYLPPAHPQTFCNSLKVAALSLDRLANEAAEWAKTPYTKEHTHVRVDH